MYVATTNSIRVIIEPQFLADQSSPEENIFVWAYNVRIENNGKIIHFRFLLMFFILSAPRSFLEKIIFKIDHKF